MSWLSPARWLAVAALVAALLAGYGMWTSQQRNIGRAEVRAEWQAETIAAAESARTRERELKNNVEKATQNATIRETKLSADAARARSNADSLRDELESARGRLPALTREAVDQYADSASVVFAACVREYSDLAKAADGHASDTQTLDEGWPR